MSSAQDPHAGRAERRRIAEAIRSTGNAPGIVVVGRQPEASDCRRVLAAWIEILTQGGAHLVNAEVSEAACAEAIEFHLAAIAQARSRLNPMYVRAQRNRLPGEPVFPPPRQPARTHGV